MSDAYADAPTMMEQGIDMTFINWRGFFAAPGLPDDDAVQAYQRHPGGRCTTRRNGKRCAARNGWVNIHNSGDDFRDVPGSSRNTEIGDLMRTLGFI